MPAKAAMTATLPASAATDFLLDLDPDLASGIDDDEWELARQASPADVVRIPRGEWAPPGRTIDSEDIVGLIVCEGVLGREAALSDHYMLELLCRGDVLLQPTVAPERPRFGNGVKLTALSDAVLIALSGAFIQAAARWPALLANVHRRLESQRERLAIQGLTAHLPRAADRLLLTLWLLADSCGRVTPEGTLIPLTLTHDILGRLAAARRPTVTLALRELETGGCIRRRRNGHLVLTAAAEQEIAAITSTSSTAPTVGRSIKLDQRQNHVHLA